MYYSHVIYIHVHVYVYIQFLVTMSLVAINVMETYMIDPILFNIILILPI